MQYRAVIVDVYRTLLTVGEPPADADARWERLWRATFPAVLAITLEAFQARCRTETEREHTIARARGIAFPEVFWPDITKAAAPELDKLSPSTLDNFLFEHAQLQRTVSLAPGAFLALKQLLGRGVLLGIASNAQPYTLRELSGVLRPTGLDLDLFAPDLVFWSFAAGFSKPDPHVFRWLTARLAARGIAPEQACMIGDRVDNDIGPARSFGWATWHLRMNGEPGAQPGGDWHDWLNHAV